MTAGYDDYKQALIELRDLPSRTATELEQARLAHAKANALADEAVTAADKAVADALKAVQAQLAEARTALGPLGLAELVPARIHPNAGADPATREDMAEAGRSLVAAVDQLRQVTQAEAQRIAADTERRKRETAQRQQLAREAAERAAAAAARRKRLVWSGVAVVIVVVTAVLVVFLTR